MTAVIAALFIALLALPQTAQAQSKEAYVVEDGSTLTFYYDTNKATHTTGTVYGINDKRKDDTKVPAWAGVFNDPNERITKVVFDSSFKDYKPATTSSWFCSCKKLTAIEGMSNLITDQVTDMYEMFYRCSALTSLDVSNFNTANVTDMGSMFRGCSALTSLNVSNFNTANVTDMDYMFNNCSALKSLDVSKFNTAKVTDMKIMFSACSALTSLDISNFNTANVTDMSTMFSDCSSLTTIFCNDDWKSDVVQKSTDMFMNCTKLKGAVSYDANKLDVTMANPTTGYFTKKSATGITHPTVAEPLKRQGIYNLQGVKMQGSLDLLPAGVYIVDGKKIVKK